MPRSSLPYFDVSQPIPGGIQTIQNLLGQYSTAEAADRDFPASGYARPYIEKQYQNLTGDYFADPFKDNASVHSSAAMDAAMSGASMAVGGNAGPRLLSGPRMVAADETGKTMVPALRGNDRVAALQSTINRNLPDPLDTERYSLDVTRDDSGLRSLNENEFSQRLTDRVDTLNHPVARQILAEIGAQRSNPEIDPLFQQQAGAGGKAKAIAAGQFDQHLLSNSKFQYLLKTNRELAARTYKAVTGREMESDVQSQVAENVTQRENRGRLLDEIKDPVYDSKTGVLMNRVWTKDPTNPLAPAKPELRPVSAFQRQAMEAEGGSIRRWGIPAQQRKLPPNLTPQESHAFVTRMDKHLDSGLEPEAAYTKANNELAAEQAAHMAVASNPAVAQAARTDDQRNWGVRTGDALGTAAAQVANAGIDFGNDFMIRSGYMQGNATLPLLPIPRGGFRSDR